MGANLVGMEGGFAFDAGYGPVAGQDYPVLSTRLVDYLRSKGFTILRLLFSWERMSPTLGGTIPAAGAGYRTYLGYYKQVVDYATSLGLHVIVEPWQVSADGGAGGASFRGRPLSTAADAAAFASAWGRMATIFAGNPRVHYGLVNEPNSMSTMTWFAMAQKAIDAIRAAGAKTPIHVPGNGWTGAGSWTDAWYDTAQPQRSNAYGWLNANGPGQRLRDPLSNLLAEVHLYADQDAGGVSTQIASPTILADRLRVAVTAARAGGYRIFVGEVGLYAGAPNALAAWRSLRALIDSSGDVVAGFCWWAAGDPEWWQDPAADGGGHFSVSPTSPATFMGDTVNMWMLLSS